MEKKKFVQINIHVRKMFNVYWHFLKKGETTTQGILSFFILTSHVFSLLGSPWMLWNDKYLWYFESCKQFGTQQQCAYLLYEPRFQSKMADKGNRSIGETLTNVCSSLTYTILYLLIILLISMIYTCCKCWNKLYICNAQCMQTFLHCVILTQYETSTNSLVTKCITILSCSLFNIMYIYPSFNPIFQRSFTVYGLDNKN